MIIQAKKQNDLTLANLILNAIGNIANTLTGENEKDKILEELNKYINMDINRLSYKNICIYKINNKIAGLIITYDSNKIKALDKPILENLANKGIFMDSLEKECFNNELYIDTVSVFEEFQGQGFAKELFTYIIERAKELGFNKLSLLVAFDNHKALKLYEKIGFRKNTILEVSNHNYHHMIKII